MPCCGAALTSSTEGLSRLMNRIRTQWRALRSHQWLSLGFDVFVIITAFLLIHGWNTRKQKMTPEHIQIAKEHIVNQGWLSH